MINARQYTCAVYEDAAGQTFQSILLTDGTEDGVFELIFLDTEDKPSIRLEALDDAFTTMMLFRNVLIEIQELEEKSITNVVELLKKYNIQEAHATD